MKQLLRTLVLTLLVATAVTTVHADDRGRHRGWGDSGQQSGSGHSLRGDEDDDRSRGRGRDRENDDQGRRENDDSAIRISLSEAVKMAKRQYGADVVRTETRVERGRTVYHLLLHSEGRVWTVRVDAHTGAMN